MWTQADTLTIRRPHAVEVLECNTTPIRFARSVLRAADQIKFDLREEQFVSDWRHPYPTEEVERLRAHVRAMKT